MLYAKLKPDNSFDRQIPNVNTEWDANNYCTPEALIKDGKADQFSVVELHETLQATFDATTQTCAQDGAELVDGQWQTKWLVSDMTPEQLEALRKASIPKVVSIRQARRALLQAGLLTLVEAGIEAQDEPLKSEFKIDWEYATEVDRQWPTLLALQPALGLTDAQIDDLFILASTL